MAKKVSDYIPVLKDLNLNHVAGAADNNTSIQGVTISMPISGVVAFEDYGLSPMADLNYQVIPINQTNSATPATVAKDSVSQITLDGPAENDVVDIVIVGKLAGQNE